MLPWQSTEDEEAITTTIRPNPRQIILIVLKWLGLTILIGILIFFTIFGIDFNPRVNLRKPFASVRPDSGPLTSCFEHYIPEESLNHHYGIIPSVPVIEEHTCYEYAALLKTNHTNTKPMIYHTFWSSKITSFSENHFDSIRSVIATQPTTTTLYLWISSQDYLLLQKSNLWRTMKSPSIKIKMIETEQQDLVQNTPLSSSWNLQTLKQQKDLLRLVTLYRYGGVWFDLEVLFVRDMSPLLDQEWLSQANCYETSYAYTSGSRYEGVFLHFYKQSPYLCEMMAEADQQLTKSSDLEVLESLGSHLYARIYHRLMKYRMQPWAVLPWCFTDPSQCSSKNSLPSLFRNANFDENMLSSIFAYHWHKSWTSSPGSIYKYLVNQHKKLVSW